MILTFESEERKVHFMRAPHKTTIRHFSPGDVDRFIQKISRDGPTPDPKNPHYTGLGACWVWTAGLFDSGYGQFRAKRQTYQAHRVAWMLENGDLSPDTIVCHRCDNPKCCRVEHLFAGTHADNSDDKWAKGRANPATGDLHGSKTKPERFIQGDNHWTRKNPERVNRGDKSHRAKLTDDQAKEIVERYARGGVSQKDLGDEYGISQTGILKIIKGRAWTHLSDEKAPVDKSLLRSDPRAPDVVKDVRRRYAEGERQKSIAAAHGIAQSLVSAIVTRKIYKHVE